MCDSTRRAELKQWRGRADDGTGFWGSGARPAVPGFSKDEPKNRDREGRARGRGGLERTGGGGGRVSVSGTARAVRACGAFPARAACGCAACCVGPVSNDLSDSRPPNLALDSNHRTGPEKRGVSRGEKRGPPRGPAVVVESGCSS